jgi:uncharacterized protein YuzE
MHVPEYDAIEFTHHALERMQERRLSEEDVRHILRFGEGRPGRRGMWLYEMQAASGAGTRVVVKELGSSARDHCYPAEETIMKAPTFQYDPDAEAAYIRMSQGEVAETIEVTESLYIDVDENGDPIGIEILGVDVSVLANLPGAQDETELRQLLKGTAA